MTMKPLTKENCEKNFSLAKHLMEIILFVILAIQLMEEFYDCVLFVPLTVVLSHVGTCVFLLGILNKFLCMNSESTIYRDQREVVNYHDNFLGSILVPMIFLYDVDSLIFDATAVSNLELIKQILLVAAFISAVFSRITLRFSEKHFKLIGSEQPKEQSGKILSNFEKVIVLNYCNSILNFVLCCAFWSLSLDMKWKNALSGDAVMGVTLLTIWCVILSTCFEEKKRIRFFISLAITIAVSIYFAYRLLQ